jgi:hypothetical protein
LTFADPPDVELDVELLLEELLEDELLELELLDEEELEEPVPEEELLDDELLDDELLLEEELELELPVPPLGMEHSLTPPATRVPAPKVASLQTKVPLSIL